MTEKTSPQNIHGTIPPTPLYKGGGGGDYENNIGQPAVPEELFDPSLLQPSGRATHNPSPLSPGGRGHKLETDRLAGEGRSFDDEQEPLSPQQGQNAETPGHDHAYLPRNLDFILDIPLEISVELGHTRIRIADILKLGQGSIVELTNPAGSALEVLVNHKPVAKGEVVVVNEKYGIRLTEILSIIERIEKLR